MRIVVTVGFILVLGLGSLAAAQDEDEYGGDDYDAYFGYGEEQAEDEDAPRTLLEARKMRKGYRIGGSGVHSSQAPEGREVHVVQEGDTLWDISEHYFGNPWQWPQLWSFNPEVTNPHWIYPLDQIRLTAGALTEDQAIAGAEQGQGLEPPAPLGGINQEVAPRVVVPRRLHTPGSIFLRDQGYLDREALRTVGQIVSGNEEQMMLAPSDQVYIRFREDQDVQAGQQYSIFRQIHDWERDPDERGKLVRIHGSVVIRSYDRERRIARAVISEGLDPIERGFLVARLDRRFDFVPAKRNRANVVAHIIASVRPRHLLSAYDVVFLDVGEGRGIEPGNRFFVVRKGDDWMESLDRDPEQMGNIVEVPPYRREELPKEVVAELRVVKVRKNTTIALVTRSDYDILQGETAEMRAGF